MFSAKIAHALNGAAGEHVEQLEHALDWPKKALGEGVRVDARQRHVSAETIDDQRAEREQDAFLELIGLAESGKIDVGRKLFGCRCHGGGSLASAPRGFFSELEGDAARPPRRPAHASTEKSSPPSKAARA